MFSFSDSFLFIFVGRGEGVLIEKKGKKEDSCLLVCKCVCGYSVVLAASIGDCPRYSLTTYRSELPHVGTLCWRGSPQGVTSVIKIGSAFYNGPHPRKY